MVSMLAYAAMLSTSPAVVRWCGLRNSETASLRELLARLRIAIRTSLHIETADLSQLAHAMLALSEQESRAIWSRLSSDRVPSAVDSPGPGGAAAVALPRGFGVGTHDEAHPGQVLAYALGSGVASLRSRVLCSDGRRRSVAEVVALTIRTCGQATETDYVVKLISVARRDSVSRELQAEIIRRHVGRDDWRRICFGWHWMDACLALGATDWWNALSRAQRADIMARRHALIVETRAAVDALMAASAPGAVASPYEGKALCLFLSHALELPWMHEHRGQARSWGDARSATCRAAEVTLASRTQHFGTLCHLASAIRRQLPWACPAQIWL